MLKLHFGTLFNLG